MEGILNRELIVNKRLCRAIGVAVFIISISLGGFVRIPLPFTPVPLTLQTFFVLLSGAFLGGNLGMLSLFGYLALGIAGIPLFSGSGSGLLYLSGPTGGYLVGFVLASFFVGRFIRYGRGRFIPTFAILFLGDLLLLTSGIIWLRLILGQPLSRILIIGFIPFIPGDLLKALAASALYLKVKTRLERIL
jgi:biotin transport system substrate-specific component